MSSRPWTERDERRLRGLYGQFPVRAVAAVLRRTAIAIKARAKLLRLGRDRRYTPAQVAAVRAQYRTRPAAAIAAEIGRSAAGVRQLARTLGLTRPVEPLPPGTRERVRALHAEGLLDAEIAARLGLAPRTVNTIRRVELALRVNTEALRRSKRRAFERQCRTLGLASFAELRSRAHRRFAAARGWPEDLRQSTRPRRIRWAR